MPRVSRAVTGAAGAVAAWALLPAGSGVTAIAVAGVGLLVLSGQLVRWDGVTGGGAVLLSAIILAGIRGLPPQLLVLATVGGIVAWDASATAVGLRSQLEKNSQSRRVEVAHSGLVLVATAGIGTLVTLASLVGEGVVTGAGVLPVIVGAVLVAAGLGPRRWD